MMLFEGWGLFHANRGRAAPEGWAWRGHPFHPENNVNGINAGGDAGVLGGDVHRLLGEEFGDAAVDLMRRLEAAWDPLNILDPGVIGRATA